MQIPLRSICTGYLQRWAFEGDDQLTQVCWICGANADSAEHRMKKSDLIRAYGKGPYKGPTAIAHVRENKETLIQGPRSKTIKYSQSLCQHCNTTYTQPFDCAYDEFIDWIMKNEKIVLHQRVIDLKQIYGGEWENKQQDLYKYLAKSFGCRLIDAGSTVPSDVVALFAKQSFSTALCLTVAVNEDILLMPPQDRNGFIGKGDLMAWAPRHTPHMPDSFTWDEHVSWLTICYWYNYCPDKMYGTTWIADNQFIHLGSFRPLNDDMRADLLDKVKNR